MQNKAEHLYRRVYNYQLTFCSLRVFIVGAYRIRPGKAIGKQGAIAAVCCRRRMRYAPTQKTYIF